MRAKRVFSILLAAVLVLSLMPSAALAEGDEHGGHEDWTELTSDHSGTSLDSGKYYLNDDVTLTGSITVNSGEEVTLCLNGHTLTKSGGMTIKVKGTLTICDCSATGAGTIPDKNAVYMEGGTLNLLGGVLGGNSGGNGIQESSSSVINIRGGTVKGYSSDAAIEMKGGELHISGGTIGDSNTNYGVELSNRSKLYLSGDPTFVRKPNGVVSYAEIYLVGQGSSYAVENVIYAADDGKAYTGGKLDIMLSTMYTGLEDSVIIVQGVSVANYNKFALIGIADGKALNFDEEAGTLEYGNYVPYVPKHTHGVDGGAGDIQWTEWTGGAFGDASYYYLTGAVDLGSSAVTISKDIHLCLNGQTITGSGSSLFTVNAGGSLTICDCAEGGAITNTSTNTSKYVIKAAGGGLTLYSGAVNSDKGRGISVDDGSEVTIAGGSITANQYAGIYILDGSLNMSGGTLTYHCLNGILSSNAGNTVSVTGGKILAGDGNVSVDKTGINMSKGILTVSGSPTITGTEYGINVGTATAAITGGTISANGTNGYGLNINGTASVSLGGSPAITGKSNAADICLDRAANAPSANANGQAYTGAALRIRYDSNAAADGDIIVKAVTTENAGKFTLVYPENKYLVQSGDNLILSSTPSEPPTPDHTHDVAGGNSGEAQTWNAWDGTTPLDTAGYYYLTKNVTLDAVIEVTTDVHLCLNGNTISGTSGNKVFSVTGKLTICDCQGDGKVSISGSSNRAAVRLTNSGSLTLYGGTLDGGSGNGVYANGANTKVTIAGGTVSGTRSGGALGVSGGTATITGGTVEGVKLQNRAKLYLAGTPAVGTVSMAKSGTANGSDNQIFAAAGGTAYAGGKITLTSDDENIPENTVIVQNVDDNNDDLFALTGYVLKRSNDNLVVGADSAIELSVTVPEGLTYGDTKPLTIMVDPADAELAFKFDGQSPSDNGSDQFSVTKGSDGAYSLYAGAAGDFTLTVTATKDRYSQKQETVSFSVAKAALTVTADNKSITYGNDAPTFTVTYDGFVNGETEAVLGGTLTFACDYEEGDNVGTYPITPGGLTSSNYDIEFVNGTLTVSKADYPGTVTAPAGLTATYGDTLAGVELPTDPNGTWSWKNEDPTSVGNAGENPFTLIFTPE